MRQQLTTRVVCLAVCAGALLAADPSALAAQRGRGVSVPTRVAGAQRVLRASPAVARTFIRPRQARRPALRTASAAAVTVTYTGFTAEAQTAFQYAVDLWAAHLTSSVPILIEAEYRSLGPGVLGSAGPKWVVRDFPNAPLDNTFYPVALANQLSGADTIPNDGDILARFSNGMPWYFGTDGNAPAGTYDFVSVVMHEIGHGLGFLGTDGWSGGTGSWGLGSPVMPIVWDRFVYTGSGQAFLNTTLFPNPSTTLGTVLTSENLFFDGPHTRLALNGGTARIYAPATYRDGSSFSHLDETEYPAGSPHSLMTPMLASAESIHDPGALTLAIFRDMGWTTATTDPPPPPPPPACAFTISPTLMTFSAPGGTATVRVTTTADCSWSANRSATWVSANPVTGTGTTDIAITASPTVSSMNRTATITIGGRVLNVLQLGVPCTVTTTSPNAQYVDDDAATRSLTIATSAFDCAWAVTPSVPWMTVQPASGIGAATVSYSIAANTGRAVRQGVLTVGSASIIVSQRGAAPKPYLDINGDGLGDAFLYNNATGAYSIRTSLPGSFGELNGGAWATGWKIHRATFNADNLDDLFLYNEVNGLWFKAINLGDGTFSFFGYRWAAGWSPTIVDFDGDGLSDVFLYNRTSGQWFRCVTNPAFADFSYFPGNWAGGWQVHAADFNGDGRSDLFLFNNTTDANSGRWFRVTSHADGSFSYVLGDIRWAPDWEITPADWDADGRTDLFLYRPNGQWFRVTFTETSALYAGGLWAPGWKIHAADFDADFDTDLFIYNPVNGQWFVVSNNAGAFGFAGGTWAPGWNVTVTDFDVDGRSDLLLYNAGTGQWFQVVSGTTPGAFAYQTGVWPAGNTVIGR